MKMKTCDLIDAPLDWAVATCDEGEELAQGWHPHTWVRGGQHELRAVPYAPSTDWAQGGPIIEREWIDLHCVNDSLWEAECPATGGLAMQNGPTPLIAAMRCYVASKLGDEVEIPEELA